MISPTNLKSLVPQLRRLIAEQGVTLLDDPMRLRGWLSDLAPDCTAERHLIMTALEERVPQELRRLRKLDKTTFHQLVSRLEVNRSVASERARWAVLEWAESWAFHKTHCFPLVHNGRQVLRKVLRRSTLEMYHQTRPTQVQRRAIRSQQRHTLHRVLHTKRCRVLARGIRSVTHACSSGCSGRHKT